jgi:prophage maintenance system killer protein
LISLSSKKAKELSIENFPNINNERYHNLFSIIKSNIYIYIYTYFSYESEQEDILLLVSKIFFNLLTTHSLENGNKRFATFVMVIMLYNFGYFF